GWSLSGRSAVRRPSSTVAIMPHSGSQIRQNVGLCSCVICPPALGGAPPFRGSAHRRSPGLPLDGPGLDSRAVDGRDDAGGFLVLVMAMPGFGVPAELARVVLVGALEIIADGLL